MNSFFNNNCIISRSKLGRYSFFFNNYNSTFEWFQYTASHKRNNWTDTHKYFLQKSQPHPLGQPSSPATFSGDTNKQKYLFFTELAFLMQLIKSLHIDLELIQNNWLSKISKILHQTRDLVHGCGKTQF